MKKSILLLLLVVATATTNIAYYVEQALFIIDLGKYKTRIKNENGEYGQWKNSGKTDYTIGIYGSDTSPQVVKFVNTKKKLLVKTWKYTDFDSKEGGDTTTMYFKCIDNYNDPVLLTLSYYPSKNGMRAAKWVKVNMEYAKYENEYEGEYLGR